MGANSVKVDSPSSREITCFQTIWLYAMRGCRTESDKAILRACAKPVEALLVKDALGRKDG
jgi:hypothetical protein